MEMQIKSLCLNCEVHNTHHKAKTLEMATYLAYTWDTL